MKIESSNIAFASQHTRVSQVSVQETMRAWVGNQRPDFEGQEAVNGAAGRSAALPGSNVSISEAARQALLQAASQSPSSAPVQGGIPALPPVVRLVVNYLAKRPPGLMRLMPWLRPSTLIPSSSCWSH